MLDRVKRILNKEELQANVKVYEEEKAKERIEQMEKNLLEISEFLDATQKEMINVSKQGKSEYKFVRYEDGYNKAYSEEIKMFFEQMGFDVDVVVNAINNYQFDNEIFFGLGSFSICKGIKYTFTISWGEDKYKDVF